jgi:hypothetical protein
VSDPRALLQPLIANVLPTETVILEYQVSPDADRPAVPYTGLRLIRDVARGRPAHRNRSIGPTPPGPAKDVRVAYSQLRSAIVRVTCYGADAITRAQNCAVGYDAPLRKSAYWVDKAFACAGEIVDATRLLGQHHEPVAYVDFSVRYRHTTTQDVYSIQTLDLSLNPPPGP